MGVVSNGNNWACESAYVEAGVLFLKYMATTAKIEIQAASYNTTKRFIAGVKWNAVTIAYVCDTSEKLFL